MTALTLVYTRKRLKLSQAKLARLLGVAPNSLARLERGERAIGEPLARLLLLIARLPPARAEVERIASTAPKKKKEKKP